MVLWTSLAAGAALGIRHALESDHLAAVMTLVDDDESPSYVGASWGVGHSIPVVVLGLLFVVFDVRLPASVTKFFEIIVGLVLLLLGAQMLRSAVRSVGVSTHNHGGSHHSHFRLNSLSVGLTHSHLKESSFFVGVIHGFAGSGALVIALVSTAPTVTTALSFLVGFSILSIVTMAAVSYLWGHLVDTSFTTYLRGVAGIAGIGFGMILLLEQAGIMSF